MTQFFEDFMEQRKDWGLTVSPSMQAAIDKANLIEANANEMIDLLAPYYPDNPSNNAMYHSLCDCINALMDQFEKRIVRFILCESEPIGTPEPPTKAKHMKQD